MSSYNQSQRGNTASDYNQDNNQSNNYDQYNQDYSYTSPNRQQQSLPQQTLPPMQQTQQQQQVSQGRRPSNNNSFVQQSSQQQPQHSFGPNYNNPSLQSLNESNQYNNNQYYDDTHENSYGPPPSQNQNWDSRSSYSHTALTMEKDYGNMPPSLPYGAPSYPPSSPLLGGPQQYNQNGIFGNRPQPSYYNDNDQYSIMRQKMLDRRSVRQIELTDGHLVLEVPVPRSIKQYNSYKGEDLSEESGKLRYTAVVDDPDDFTR